MKPKWPTEPIACALLIFTGCVTGQTFVNTEVEDINTVLMQSTFRIHGPAVDGTGTSVGTVFIVGRPIKDQPKRGAYVLVTAAHVLESIKGETGTLLLRQKSGDGTYKPFLYEIAIRDKKGNPLYVKHGTADVVAMYVRLPATVTVPLLMANVIASDKTITDLEIHPGDELLCLGYPFGLTVNDWGFPILRSGIVSSYPLTPASAVKFIGFDFRVYGGNSGGPVYFKYSNRVYSTGTHLGETVNGIIGLVTQEVEDPNTKTPISLARIVPGQFIVETLDMLPEPPQI
jgi:hypothetical protein